MNYIIVVLFITGGLMQADSLTDYQWKHRLIVVADNNQEAISYFKNLSKKHTSSWNERKLKLITLDKNKFSSNYPPKTFAVLVGLDGSAKTLYKKAPQLKTIYSTIDAMPMRQQEIQDQQP